MPTLKSSLAESPSEGKRTCAHAGLPALASEMLKAATTAQAKAGFEAMSVWVSFGSPAEMAAVVRRDHAYWGDFIRKLGIRPE